MGEDSLLECACNYPPVYFFSQVIANIRSVSAARFLEVGKIAIYPRSFMR
jgi:hypothetical protein